MKLPPIVPHNAAGQSAFANELESGDAYNDNMNIKSLAASVNIGIHEAALGDDVIC